MQSIRAPKQNDEDEHLSFMDINSYRNSLFDQE